MKSSVEDQVPSASPLSALIRGVLPIFVISGPYRRHYKKPVNRGSTVCNLILSGTDSRSAVSDEKSHYLATSTLLPLHPQPKVMTASSLSSSSLKRRYKI
jgi:hypothetical protein